MRRGTIRLAMGFLRARPAASKRASRSAAETTQTPHAGERRCDPLASVNGRHGGWAGAALLRYVGKAGRRPAGEILAGAEERGLWKDTPFESADTFAAFVGSSGGRGGPDQALAGATTGALYLAARTVEARGRDPLAVPSEVMGVANGLSRYLLVAGLVRQLDSAGRN